MDRKISYEGDELLYKELDDKDEENLQLLKSAKFNIETSIKMVQFQKIQKLVDINEEIEDSINMDFGDDRIDTNNYSIKN